MSPPEPGGWDGYVDRFHTLRPGITETVLGACRAGGTTPYEWLAASIGSAPTVADLACGSAPVAPLVKARRQVGIDRSEAELHLARSRHPDVMLVRADAAHLPLRDRSVGGVTCSMGLMVAGPLGRVVREMLRITDRGGALALLLPTNHPLSRRDRTRYLALAIALRARPARFPNPAALSDVHRILEVAGYHVDRDESRRFSYPISDAAAAEALVGSFYLPGVTERRRAAATRAAGRWIGSELGIPLRHVSATARR